MPEAAHPVFVDGSHVYIGGVTGSGEEYGGKTATANWWASTAVDAGHFDFMLAFDPKGRNFDGADVSSVEEAANAVREGARKLDWQPSGDPTDMESLSDQHATAMRFADGLNGSVIVVHDDAVLYADSDSMKWATALAGNPGPGGHAIKSLVVSQDPWDLPRKGVRANLTTMVWVGPVTDDANRYFENMKKAEAAERVKARHEREGAHSWTIVDGDTLTTFEPVPERYA